VHSKQCDALKCSIKCTEYNTIHRNGTRCSAKERNEAQYNAV
jgi:hypothetical protein